MTVAIFAATAGISFATAGPAQAYSCAWRDARVSDGTAEANFHICTNCSDGKSDISGNLKDISCDNRSAYLELYFHSENNPFPFRVERPGPANGCGAVVNVNYTSTNPSPRLRAHVYSANGGPGGSSGDERWI